MPLWRCDDPGDFWMEPGGDRIYSPSLGDFDLLPPPPPRKGRRAQDAALLRLGHDPDEVRRAPLRGPEPAEEVNEQGVLLPPEEIDLRNERR